MNRLHRLHRLQWGSVGPTLLFVHGLTGCAALWEPVARCLPGFRIIAPDLRGHGASPRAGAFTLADHTADLAALLEEIGPALVVGHSLGAVVAWQVAAACPDLIMKLVIEDQHPEARPEAWKGWGDWAAAWPGSFTSRDEGLRFLAHAGRTASWWEPSLIERPDATWGWAFDFEAVTATAKSLCETESWKTLADIQSPTLLLRGEKSPHLTAEVAERMRRTIPQCQLITVAGADHWIHSDPVPFASRLEKFLSTP